jgi:hypothetical protein
MFLFSLTLLIYCYISYFKLTLLYVLPDIICEFCDLLESYYKPLNYLDPYYRDYDFKMDIIVPKGVLLLSIQTNFQAQILLLKP